MTDTHQYTNTHTNISFLTNQIGSECSFKLFLLLPKIKDAGKKWHPDAAFIKHSHAGVSDMPPLSNIWDVKYQTGFVPSKITRNILMACPFVYSSISSFLTCSQSFSAAVGSAATLSALSFAPFWLLFAVLARAFALAWVPPNPSTLWVTTQRQTCPLPDFYSLSAGEVKLISEKTQALGTQTARFPALLVQSESKAVNPVSSCLSLSCPEADSSNSFLKVMRQSVSLSNFSCS